jgi:hypothetical protein
LSLAASEAEIIDRVRVCSNAGREDWMTIVVCY